MKKPAATIIGITCLILGITLVLAWWPDVVRFSKGIGGMALAVGGILLLALSKD